MIVFMKNIILSISFISLFTFCSNKQNEKEASKADDTIQKIEVTTDYQTLFKTFTKNDNVLYVVNYWATWCKPCVEELPHFMEINEEMNTNNNFKMILVSLDKANDMETELKPFIANNNIPTDVYLLSDNKRMSEWIPLVNKNWSGAIPATAIYKNGKQVAFTEGELSKTELKELINQHTIN